MEITHLPLFHTMLRYRAIALNANTQFLNERREVEKSHIHAIETLEKQIQDLKDPEYICFNDMDKIGKLEVKVEEQKECMKNDDKEICLRFEIEFNNRFDRSEQWFILASYAQTTNAEDVGCFSFQCNNIERRLRLFIQALAHNNTPNNLENHLAFFIPEVLLKPHMLKPLINALNNPRPSKSHKEFSRYLQAVEAQKEYTLAYLFEFHKLKAMVVEFLEQIVAGATFETGDKELDLAGNYATAKAQKASKILLEKISFNMQEYLQNNFFYKADDFTTYNAKGLPRSCETSPIQKKLIENFNLSLTEKHHSDAAA